LESGYFKCKYPELVGFSQEKPVPVNSLRLDYYLGLGLFFRVRLSHSFLSFTPLFSPLVLSSLSLSLFLVFVLFVPTAKKKKKSKVLKVALVFLFAKVEKPMPWRS
jgi:hypothetical protein